MTSNLPLVEDGWLDDEAFAAACRKAAVGLAGHALTLAGGDPDKAKAALRGPLEAIGALPYEPGRGKYRWGQPPPGGAA